MDLIFGNSPNNLKPSQVNNLVNGIECYFGHVSGCAFTTRTKFCLNFALQKQQETYFLFLLLAFLI